MNKNGLQMLHNILKQNCKNYIKIPIVRKLFKEFVCALTGHNDSEVQEIAQRFRDKWIPCIIKNAENKEGLVLNKVELIFNDYEMNSCRFSVKEPKMVSRQTNAIDCLSQTPVEQENVADGLFSRSDQYEVRHGTQDLSFHGRVSSVMRRLHRFLSRSFIDGNINKPGITTETPLLSSYLQICCVIWKWFDS